MKPQDIMSPVLAELHTIRTQLDGIDRRLDRLQVKGARAGATGLGAHTGATGGVMAHSRATREGLRRAYVFDNLSLELAAIQCGVSVHSARRWKKEALNSGDDWEVIRSALSAGQRCAGRYRARHPDQPDGAVSGDTGKSQPG
ncbi:MAG: DUF1804 family protein [Sodalis sp. (in: enterobacteria)]|uniref:DUF1804 family protein n=1 Tax=Sodalis sp. (in: enterobacteria) TaxID=1898979 RepID=UPI003F3A41DB